MRRLATAGLAAVVATMVTVAVAPSAAYADIPGIDEISSSTNMTQLANVPKSAAFADLNSDLAFQGKYAFSGNYNGFVVYDISNPSAPAVVSEVVCVGAQNDISVHGNLLFLSTDSSRSNDSCNSVAQSAANKASWEGIKIFDITDKANPRYIKSVETSCGSHTHTLVPAETAAYLYISSYSPSASFPDCLPPHDSISIVKVPLADPTSASVIAEPNLFPDGGTQSGGYSSATTGCHDITVYPAKKIAAGACMGDGILMDISNPEAPVVTERVKDLTNFAFWHSATFNNAGTKVIFTDELGGGGGATCNPTVGPKRGADAIYDLVGGKLQFKSYFKIPRENAASENCVAHNGSVIPAMGKDIFVQAWYQGGISVYDFTDSANPVEIGFWERGPLATTLRTGGSWSAYYYNGYIYSNDIAKGFDVIKIDDPKTNSAKAVHFPSLNVQTQPEYPVCDSVVTGRQAANLVVSEGVACVDGGDLRGTVTIDEGAKLLVYGSRVAGNVAVGGGGSLSIVDSDLRGSVTTTGLSDVYLAGNKVASAVVINGTTGSAIISGNELRGGVFCASNAVTPTDEGTANTIRGAAFGDCSALR